MPTFLWWSKCRWSRQYKHEAWTSL